MNRRNFLLSSAASVAATLPAMVWADCASQTRDQCDPVAERSFGSGSINRAPDCEIDFRLPAEIQQAITLNDGTFSWVLRLITINSAGQVSWTTAKTIENTGIRRQGIYFGTYAAVYVTCDQYTGWISTGKIDSCSHQEFEYVDWKLDYRALDALERRQGS